MNYQCVRCSKTYKRACDLKQHLQRQEIPCDNICSKCGQKFSSQQVYKRHTAKNKCIAIAIGNNNTINSNNNQITVNNQITIQKTEPITFNLDYLKRAGMCPHETCQENLLSDNASKLLALIEDHMKTYYFCNNNDESRTKMSKDEQYKQLIMKIVELYYSNPLIPHHINIIDNDPESLHDLLYGGSEFVNDVLSKDKRNERVLQIIYFRLSEFANKYNIPPFISDFIENELLPHIIRGYFDKSYNTLLQNTWRKNTKLISQIISKLGAIPPCQLHEQIQFNNQIQDMKEKAKYMHTQHNFLTQMELDNVQRTKINLI